MDFTFIVDLIHESVNIVFGSVCYNGFSIIFESPIARSRLLEPRQDVSDDAKYRSRRLTPCIRAFKVRNLRCDGNESLTNHIFDDTPDVLARFPAITSAYSTVEVSCVNDCATTEEKMCPARWLKPYP